MSNKKYILDTDIGTDSDDIGALVILLDKARKGTLTLSAVTVCNARDDSAMTVDIIAERYGIEVPIGKALRYGADAQHGAYARAIASVYPSRLYRGEIESAVRVLRRTLDREDRVTLITIGPLTNIADLARSEADDISPYSGKELMKKIDSAYVMGGRFSDLVPEWNVEEDIPSAIEAISALDCEITFIPFEAGVDVYSGKNFLDGPDTPMKLGYYVHNVTERHSWDPLTVYCATEGRLPTSPRGVVTIADDGVTTFCPSPDGKHRYVLREFDVAEMSKKLNDLMVI